MAISRAQANAEWDLAKLVHELDMQNNARLRDRIARLGITGAQAAALREMAGPMSISELAGRMGCEASNAAVVVDRLERQNLVERREHPTDRRARLLSLTAEGTALRKKLLKVLTEAPLFLALTEPEQDALRELVQRALVARYRMRR